MGIGDNCSVSEEDFDGGIEVTGSTSMIKAED